MLGWRTGGVYTAAMAVGMVMASGSAMATNGMLPHCVGVHNCGTGGAGMAQATDASNLAINPALLGKLKGSEVSLSAGWFHPERSLKPGTGSFSNTAGGAQSSQVEDYPDGALGISYKASPEWSFGMALYSGGGGETKYTKSRVGAGGGITNNYDLGVRIRMGNLATGVSWTPSPTQSYGASLILGYQDFNSDMANATFAVTQGRGQLEKVYGWGARVGGLWDVAPWVTLAATAQTPIMYKRLEKYHDLFLGAIEQPGNLGVGTSFHIGDSLNLMADYKLLMWNRVRAIGTGPAAGGFGWQNQPVYMLGASYDVVPAWTIRAGWNYGPSPIPEDTTFANGLFPAVVEHHFTLGTSIRLGPQWEISGAGYYAPEHSQTDPGTGDGYSIGGKGTTIDMSQYGAQMGVKFKF
ncbi:MAG: outer membrane protein transport protein [Magnetospirillum sp.]|nr:outer membrane protein transport protein [Magnetospirillum sp.]